MAKFRTRITEASSYAGEKFRERMLYSEDVENADRREGQIYASVLMLPVDFCVGLFGKDHQYQS